MQNQDNTNLNKYRVVFSFPIAESLCADYPHFRDLVKIEQSNKYPKRQVWIFKRSEQFDKNFEELVQESRNNKIEREKQINESNTAD